MIHVVLKMKEQFSFLDTHISEKCDIKTIDQPSLSTFLWLYDKLSVVLNIWIMIYNYIIPINCWNGLWLTANLT